MRSYKLEQFGEPLVESVVETPEPEGHEVLLTVDACGVCHSDVHLQDGYFDLGNDRKLNVERIVSPPRTLGHEISGTVTAVGPDADGISVGDRRIIFPWIGCGECALCLAGNEHLCNAPRALGLHCDGGFADHVLVPHSKYLLQFDPLPEVQACTYACAGLTAYSALKKAGPLTKDDTLMIIGAGGVGLSGIRLAKPLYDIAPIVVEIDKNKWGAAEAAGASEVIDPREEGALKTLLRATRGGVTAAVDFVGAEATFSFGFGALGKAGKLVSVGLFGGAAPVSPAIVAMKAVTITGSYVGSLNEMQELMKIARSGELPDLPVQTRKLDAVNDALTDLKEGRVEGRVVLQT